jgi:hypothetical protein
MHDKLDGLFLTDRSSGSLGLDQAGSQTGQQSGVALCNATNNPLPLENIEIWSKTSGRLHSFSDQDMLVSRGEIIFKPDHVINQCAAQGLLLVNSETHEYVGKNDIDNLPNGFPGLFPVGVWQQETRIKMDRSIPCFTAGTILATRDGEKRIEDLRPGDHVITRDSGFMPVQAISHQSYTPAEQRLNRDFRPIVIPALTFENTRDLHLSPAHRIMLNDGHAELMFGSPEVLVAAKTALEYSVVHQQPAEFDVVYYHILLPRHELMLVEGIWVESLFLGDMPERVLQSGKTWDTLDGFDMNEARHDGTIRPVLRGKEARSLMHRLPDCTEIVAQEYAPNNVFLRAA